MYLKSLQLVGFKSFAERTTIEFLPGVTAIVGPNGCGKSNVADAIRWVLGEQSAKALRGGEMADVIFSGTDARKAINLAEVSMTFADVDPKTLSLPGVNLDFNEITITRRVHRDGQGEYFINKTPCRLRDIQGLFMDTGIGRSSYSLMAQGQIDQILSAHPEDRRMIFEEAAGINKYKHQKKEALRKLEYTEQNLVRLTDIIKEVKRQIISLQRQAGKARRYKELFDQLKTLDLRLSRHKYDEMLSVIRDLESQIATLASQAQQFAATIADHEAQIGSLRQSLAEIDSAINEAVNRDHDLRSEADRHQQRITTNGERIVEAEQLIEQNRREIAAAEEKIHIQEQELVRLNGEFDQILFLLGAEEGKLRAHQEDLKLLETTLGQRQRELEALRRELIEIERSQAAARNEIAALDLRRRNDRIRRERLLTEQFQLDEQRQVKRQQLNTFQAGLTELRASLEPLRVALTSVADELKQAREQLATVIAVQRATESEAGRKAARLEVLRQLFAAPDGRVTLANILDVEPQYGPAIETALSQHVRTMLADDVAGARALLAGTTKNPSVTAPDLPRLNGDTTPGEVPLGAMEWAVNVVRVRDERFAPLVRALLHNVVVASDLDVALSLRQHHPHLAVATVAGELVSLAGTISALSTSHMGEIALLGAELAETQARAGALAAQAVEWEKRCQTLEERLSAIRTELHAKEVALAAKEGEWNALQTEERDLDVKVSTVASELQAIDQQDSVDQQRIGELLAAEQAAGARLAEWQNRLAEMAALVEELQREREAMFQQQGDLRVSVGALKHRRDSIQQQREPIAGRIRDFRDRMVSCTQANTVFASRIEQFRTEISESEQRIAELQVLREQAAQQLSGYQHQRREVATGIEQLEAELRAVRLQAASLQETKSRHDVMLAQKQMELQQLRERVAQRYQINVEEVPAEVLTVTLADQGPVVTEQVPLSTDWDALEQQVIEMQSRLDAMGQVNLDAIHEFEELEQRYQFLSQQHDDLVKAKEQLLQVISKINATTKQLFHETFQKIRDNFQLMFAELFGGGKANLILLDENDPLESGIEIVAKPPGKQLQSITLLSGGEKTLTATALLFSIYMVKPSPFCVLDELDAPLDESNINRFIRILSRFIHQSQFVIITHNKRTIGMADALYGITMEEHGISKVVSVKFSPREESKRRQVEQNREVQEKLIDTATLPGGDVRPHEEDIRNDLLKAKEETVAPIAEAAPVVAEIAPAIGQAAPAIAAEVKEVVAAVTEVVETVGKTVAAAEPSLEEKR